MRSASIGASASERAEEVPTGGGDAAWGAGVVVFAKDDSGEVADPMDSPGLPTYGLAELNCHAVLVFDAGDEWGDARVSEGLLSFD